MNSEITEMEALCELWAALSCSINVLGTNPIESHIILQHTFTLALQQHPTEYCGCPHEIRKMMFFLFTTVRTIVLASHNIAFWVKQEPANRIYYNETGATPQNILLKEIAYVA